MSEVHREEHRELDIKYEVAMGRCPHPLIAATAPRLSQFVCSECGNGFSNGDVWGTWHVGGYGCREYHKNWNETWKIVEEFRRFGWYMILKDMRSVYTASFGFSSPPFMACASHVEPRIAILKAAIFVAEDWSSNPKDPSHWDTVKTDSLRPELCPIDRVFMLPPLVRLSKFNRKMHPEDAKKCGVIIL